VSRDGVEPLQVVDRDDRGGVLGETPQRLKDGPSPDERVGVRMQHGRIGLDLIEQIEEPDERERHLLLSRTGHQHPEARCAASLERPAPECRLADPGITADEHRVRSLREGR